MRLALSSTPVRPLVWFVRSLFPPCIRPLVELGKAHNMIIGATQFSQITNRETNQPPSHSGDETMVTAIAFSLTAVADWVSGEKQ